MSALRILHLTDTHLFGDETLHYGVVDTAERLRLTLAHMADRPFDLVVCSGDVSEDGSEGSYRRARDLIGERAREHGARAVFAMGNHDRRAPFRAVLGGGQPDADEQILEGADAPIASVAEHGGWRVIVLDSSVPGRGYGAIDQAQKQFFEQAVHSPAEHGTVVVVHHPPIDAQTDLLQALCLDEQDAAWLLSTIQGTDVRVILSGHYHLPVVETVCGVPIVVAPGVANIARAFDRRTEESAIDAYGGATVDISAGRVRVVPFQERMTVDAEVFRFTEDAVVRIIAAAGR